jgi:hypothetical protein
MKRFALTCMLAALSAQALAATSPAAAPTAIEIQIGGIGPAVDAAAYRKVKLLLADALYRDTVAYFDVYGYGKEGGFSACVEKGRLTAAGSFEQLLKSLKAIKPNASTTAYNVAVVEACTYRVVPPAP